jgi:hypothetical protein
VRNESEHFKRMEMNITEMFVFHSQCKRFSSKYYKLSLNFGEEKKSYPRFVYCSTEQAHLRSRGAESHKR